MKIILFLQLVLHLTLASTNGLHKSAATRLRTVTAESFGNLIYDVTAPLKNNYLTPRNETRQSALERDSHVSYYAYLKLSQNYTHSPVNITKYLSSGLLNETAEIGLIFPRHHMRDDAQHSYSILIRMKEGRHGCKKYCSHLQSHFPNQSDRKNHTGGVKLGLEVKWSSMKCFKDFCPLILSNLDILVYIVEVQPLQSLLSYGLFEEKLKTIYKENFEFIRDFNSKCQFYARLSVAGYSQPISDTERDLYRAAIATNAVHLVAKGNGIRMITDIYPKDAEVILKARESSIHINPTATIYTAQNLLKEALCGIGKFNEAVSTSVSKIILQIDNHVIYGGPYHPTACNVKKHTSALGMNKTNLPNILLKGALEFQIMPIAEAIEKQTRLHLKTVYFEKPYKLSRNFSDLVVKRHVNFGCLVQDFSDKFRDIGSNSCGFDIFLEWLDYFRVEDHEELSYLLEKSLAVRDKFRETYANVTMALQLHVTESHLESVTASRLNIYCTPRLNDMNQFDEAVMKWSTIHNVDVILHPLIDTSTESGWWFPVVTDKELNRTEMEFVLLVRRNSKKMENNNFVLPFTYPCIEWTSHLSNLNYAPIHFGNANFSGVTVNLNIPRESPLTPFEIQTMLSFAYGRFSSVEFTGSDANVEQISKALVTNLKDALPHKLSMMLEFTDVNLLRQLQRLKSASFPPSGVHISKWEAQNSETKRLLNDQLKVIDKESGNSRQLNFGVTVQDCISEINSNFTALKALEYFKFIRYIVCVVKPVRPSNVDKRGMQIYLDTIFYIQQYLKTGLGLDTYFRLSFLPSRNEADTGNYLRFLGDLSQHANAYKIKYFFGDAFAGSGSDLWSWWRITDYSDLSNASAYIESESEYFGRPTEQKYKILPDVEDDTTSVLLLSTLSIFLIAAICGLWLYHRRVKKNLMTVITKKEVHVFRYGEKVDLKEEQVAVTSVQTSFVTNLGFEAAFEIPRKDINTIFKIGEGHFGEVWAGYLGPLDDDNEVAIKFPKDVSNRESVLSVMDEVRTYSHIGCHPNVVKFLGACTTNVAWGEIYMVTEYCKHGSLDNYLLEKRPRPTVETILVPCPISGYDKTKQVEKFCDINENSLLELHKFACEIAEGMDYIGKKLVTHCDLSARNIMVTGYGTCKIGDFGLSRKLYERYNFEHVSNRERRLPWIWMAPETLNENRSTRQSDVWSFGILLFEIYSYGGIPFPDVRSRTDFEQTVGRTLHISKPCYATDEIYAKMLECCNILPDQRPTFVDLARYFGELAGTNATFGVAETNC